MRHETKIWPRQRWDLHRSWIGNIQGPNNAEERRYEWNFLTSLACKTHFTHFWNRVDNWRWLPLKQHHKYSAQYIARTSLYPKWNILHFLCICDSDHVSYCSFWLEGEVLGRIEFQRSPFGVLKKIKVVWQVARECESLWSSLYKKTFFSSKWKSQ